MNHLVITVFAPDKAGQVERIAQCIAEHGGNWLESCAWAYLPKPMMS